MNHPAVDVTREIEPRSTSRSENPRLIEATERFLADLEAGKDPSVEEYIERYPDVSKELADCLKNLEFLHRIAPQLSEVGGREPAGAKQFQACPTLGDYRILHEIGRGGMGVVYAAEQLSLARKVALKVLPFAGVLDQRQLQRFKSEAQAAALLHHQNIVPVYGLGSDRGVHFYAMQFIEGQTLAELIQDLRRQEGLEKSEPLALATGVATVAHRASQSVPSPSVETERTPQAVIATERSIKSANYFRSIAELGIQAADALDHAHEEGVVHRDIKPSNLILDARGKLWVTDFGLAFVEANPGLTMTGDLVGTLRYMSPEQALAKRVLLDARTDIYSLCATLYELLTLQPVVNGSDRQEVIKQIVFEEPRPPRHYNRTVPAELGTILLKGLEKNPEHRYSSAKKLADDLRRFLDNRPIQAKPPSLLHKVAKWSDRNKTLVRSGTVVFALITIGLAISTFLVSREVVRATQAERLAASRFHSERDARHAEQEARTDAEQAKTLAEGNAAAAYRQQYKAEMQLGLVDLGAGNLSRLYDTLIEHFPAPSRADRRGWEWYYLLSRCEEGRTLCEHYSTVNSLAWSPDGRYLATASSDGDAIVWDAQTGQRVRRFSFGSTLKRGVAWSPDSQCLAWGSVGSENAVRIWDCRTDEIRILRGHTHSLMTCVWNPDGSRLATTAMDKTARIWDAATGTSLHVLSGHLSFVNATCWMADGKSLVTAGYDGVKVWDAATGKLSREMLAESQLISASMSAASPQRLVLGTESGQCSLVSTDSWQVLHEIPAHAGKVNAVAFSPDGATFASGGADGTAIVCDTADGRQLYSLRSHHGQVISLAWNPRGNQLATGYADGQIKLWDIPAPQQPQTFAATSEPIQSLTWSKDDRSLTSQSKSTRTNWNPATMSAGDRTSIAAETCEAISPDGRMRASTTASKSAFKILVEDVQRRETACELHFNLVEEYPVKTLPTMVWSPDGRQLLVFENKHFEVWEIPSANRLYKWEGPTIHAVSWASDSTRLAVAGGGDLTDNGSQAYQGHVHAFDIASKARLSKVSLREQTPATAVAWHPDGESFSTGNQNGLVGVWDANTGSKICSAKLHVATVKALDWTPDGRRIASASVDGSLKLWDPLTGDELLSLVDGKEPLMAVKWSSDGARLATGDNLGKIQVWDASAGIEILSGTDQRLSLARIHHKRSLQLFDSADVPGALRELNRAIELAPSSASYRLSRARAYARQGRLDESLADLTAARDLDPGDILVMRYRLDLHAELGRWTDALADASRRAELKQDPIDRYFSAVVHLMLGEADACRDICRRQFAGAPDELNYSLSTRAWTCSLAPKPAHEFERFLPLARELVKGATEAWVGDVGPLFYRAGHVEEALEYLTTASRAWEQSGSIVSPSSYFDRLPGYTWYFLAMACHDLGRFAESRSWYDKAETYAQLAVARPTASAQPNTSNWLGLHAVNWHQRVVLEMLQRETRTKLGIADSGTQTSRSEGEKMPETSERVKPSKEVDAKRN